MGFQGGRAGEGSPAEEFLIGHKAIFSFSEIARKAKESSLPPIYSGLC